MLKEPSPWLDDAGLLDLWESGLQQHPGLRLSPLLSDSGAGTDVLDLTLGERNRLLLRAREQLFGRVLAATAACPSCAERVEFELDTRALFMAGDVVEAGAVLELESKPSLRLPTVRDLMAVAACADVESGRRVLFERCLLAQSTSSPRDLPLERLEDEIAALDPLTDIALDLTCPACDTAWQAGLDLDEYLWAEVAASARRLLTEVHRLARAYGWTEAEVLSLSRARRRAYLEMLD